MSVTGKLLAGQVIGALRKYARIIHLYETRCSHREKGIEGNDEGEKKRIRFGLDLFCELSFSSIHYADICVYAEEEERRMSLALPVFVRW